MRQLTLQDHLEKACFEEQRGDRIDFDRLCKNIRRIYELMKAVCWLSLSEIEHNLKIETNGLRKVLEAFDMCVRHMQEGSCIPV